MIFKMIIRGDISDGIKKIVASLIDDFLLTISLFCKQEVIVLSQANVTMWPLRQFAIRIQQILSFFIAKFVGASIYLFACDKKWGFSLFLYRKSYLMPHVIVGM
ncbi:hypothetical protein [Pseudobutyrivibrio sp. MD2005]|uniref:hypothetical protein n=1 Tax=Pseudobutyrivibrio sp. MD2005 TaxID=1410616 RepID=UPI000489A991|nr:hypothetical protein [Pseudobutyrivibrio sp. MD2005]